jgi:hypothetical protein
MDQALSVKPTSQPYTEINFSFNVSLYMTVKVIMFLEYNINK